MDDWTKYKEKVREEDPEIGKDIDQIEEMSTIIGAMFGQEDPVILRNTTRVILRNVVTKNLNQ